MTRSELSQHDEGDCLPSEFKSQLPEHVKLDDRPLGIGQLLDCWEKLSSHAKSHATKRGNSQGWFWNELEAIFKRRLHDESNEI